MYREQGVYLDRIYKWADQVGVDHIRKIIVGNAEVRRGYFERFVYSQQFMQTDPWAERAGGNEAAEFAPLELPRPETVREIA